VSFRFVKDRSIMSIDVKCDLEKSEIWYDLALIKNLLYNETQLDIALSFEQYCEFLKSEIDNITNLFNFNDNSNTQKKLKNLLEKRAKQMFPWLK